MTPVIAVAASRRSKRASRRSGWRVRRRSARCLLNRRERAVVIEEIRWLHREEPPTARC
jgi:hypothetical protein